MTRPATSRSTRTVAAATGPEGPVTVPTRWAVPFSSIVVVVSPPTPGSTTPV
jgi:hypothetical protein